MNTQSTAQDQEYVKLKASTAQEVLKHLELDKETLKPHDPDSTPAYYLERLIQSGKYPEAVQFLAMALPKREAVWWACLSARKAQNNQLEAERAAAVQAAEAWVVEPSEENRRKAMAAAEATEFQNSAGWAAVGAFWSGGSMAPPDAPEVPPAPELTGRAVGGAVLLAVAESGPENAEDKYKFLLDRGIDIAKGGKGVPES